MNCYALVQTTPRSIMKHASIGLCILLVAVFSDPAIADPIPWRAEDGGNNHHYERIYVPGNVTWDEAKLLAEQLDHRGVPGHLATMTSQGEHDFIWDELSSIGLFWIGGFQPEGNFAPDEGWEWVTGEPWGFTCWGFGEPNSSASNPDGFENRLQLGGNSDPCGWNDLWPSAGVPGFIVEFDTDTVSGDANSVGEVKARY